MNDYEEKFLKEDCAIFSIPELANMEDPVFVSVCKGVGPKLDVAMNINKLDTIGYDCIALCVNEIISKGARPLFFMGHIDLGRSRTNIVSEIMKGVLGGCEEAGVEFKGCGTSEFLEYKNQDDLSFSGFMSGAAQNSDILTGETIKPGNSIIGICSSGLHAEGFDLVRRAVGHGNTGVLNSYFESLGSTFGEALLTPAKIYSRAVAGIKEANIKIRGIADVAKGGLAGAAGKIIPENMYAEINAKAFGHPPIFEMIQETGGYSDEVMYNNFNMGIGMLVVVASQDRETALQAIRYSGETAFVIGSIKEGERRIDFTI